MNDEGYKFRTVACPYCQHKFTLWANEPTPSRRYSIKNGEEISMAKCPICQADFGVRENVLLGIPENEVIVETFEC